MYSGSVGYRYILKKKRVSVEQSGTKRPGMKTASHDKQQKAWLVGRAF